MMISGGDNIAGSEGEAALLGHGNAEIGSDKYPREVRFGMACQNRHAEEFSVLQ